MSNTKTPQGRLLPPNYKNVIDAQFFRKLSWKERLQILFGYRVRLTLRMVTEHKPGKFHPTLTLTTTTDLQPDEIQNSVAGQS